MVLLKPENLAVSVTLFSVSEYCLQIIYSYVQLLWWLVFKFPHVHKNSFGKQFQFMDFSISPFFWGNKTCNTFWCMIRWQWYLYIGYWDVSEALYFSSGQSRGERWRRRGGIRIQVYPSDRRINNLNYLILNSFEESQKNSPLLA